MKSSYTQKVEIRWSDLDPNYHLRHSVYYDWGAFTRFSFLNAHGFTAEVMNETYTGPILFREEALFKREIRFGDSIEINILLLKARKDMSRWTIVNEIWKNNDTLSAIITVDGAFINTQTRKLAIPNEQVFAAFDAIPKSENYTRMEL